MNESTPASPADQSEPIRKSTFQGWRWFIVPVALNQVFLALPVFDGGFTNAVTNYFSIPYLATVAVIGLRRGGRITAPDLVFLTFGNFFIVIFLWILKNPSPHG